MCVGVCKVCVCWDGGGWAVGNKLTHCEQHAGDKDRRPSSSVVGKLFFLWGHRGAGSDGWRVEVTTSLGEKNNNGIRRKQGLLFQCL